MRERPEAKWDLRIRRRIRWLDWLAARLPRWLSSILFPRLSRQLRMEWLAALGRSFSESYEEYADYPQIRAYIDARLPR
jgi:hypothetical protein